MAWFFFFFGLSVSSMDYFFGIVWLNMLNPRGNHKMSDLMNWVERKFFGYYYIRVTLIIYTFYSPSVYKDNVATVAMGFNLIFLIGE